MISARFEEFDIASIYSSRLSSSQQYLAQEKCVLDSSGMSLKQRKLSVYPPKEAAYCCDGNALNAQH